MLPEQRGQAAAVGLAEQQARLRLQRALRTAQGPSFDTWTTPA